MEKIVKRAFDILFSLVGIVLLLPLFIAISILIKRDSPGQILFKQERVGKDFKPFQLYKFRTMGADAAGRGLPITSADDSRITQIGITLRKYKLDELPQLINVLRGDMSLVGPRPEIKKYVQIFQKDYICILTMKPGLTDYAALEYRNEEELLSSYDDAEKGYLEEILPNKIILYKKYLREHSLLVDIQILLETLITLAKLLRNHGSLET